MYKVYVKTNESGAIQEINSTAFLHNSEGWIQVDEGSGDRYYHAQGNYLENGLFDESGPFNYKLVDGEIIERTDQEKFSVD